MDWRDWLDPTSVIFFFLLFFKGFFFFLFKKNHFFMQPTITHSFPHFIRHKPWSGRHMSRGLGSAHSRPRRLGRQNLK